MNVYVVYDTMNEEVIGVFDTNAAATQFAKDDPQSDTYLSVERFELNQGKRWTE